MITMQRIFTSLIVAEASFIVKQWKRGHRLSKRKQAIFFWKSVLFYTALGHTTLVIRSFIHQSPTLYSRLLRLRKHKSWKGIYTRYGMRFSKRTAAGGDKEMVNRYNSVLKRCVPWVKQTRGKRDLSQ